MLKANAKRTPKASAFSAFVFLLSDISFFFKIKTPFYIMFTTLYSKGVLFITTYSSARFSSSSASSVSSISALLLVAFLITVSTAPIAKRIVLLSAGFPITPV